MTKKLFLIFSTIFFVMSAYSYEESFSEKMPYPPVVKEVLDKRGAEMGNFSLQSLIKSQQENLIRLKLRDSPFFSKKNNYQLLSIHGGARKKKTRFFKLYVQDLNKNIYALFSAEFVDLLTNTERKEIFYLHISDIENPKKSIKIINITHHFKAYLDGLYGLTYAQLDENGDVFFNFRSTLDKFIYRYYPNGLIIRL